MQLEVVSLQCCEIYTVLPSSIKSDTSNGNDSSAGNNSLLLLRTTNAKPWEVFCWYYQYYLLRWWRRLKSLKDVRQATIKFFRTILTRLIRNCHMIVNENERFKQLFNTSNKTWKFNSSNTKPHSYANS